MSPAVDRHQNASETPAVAEVPLYETGWHDELVEHPDGTTEMIRTPLTAAEFLHPREGDHLPVNTFHDRLVSTLKESLTRWFSHQPNTCIFSDLLIEWDIDLGDHSPDICVVFDVKEPQRDRSKFVVAAEGVRPAVIIEVVSPHYRKPDREDKVNHYAQAGVPEYIILDRRTYRQQILEETIGYRLVAANCYEPIVADEQGRIFSQVLGLLISLQDGQVVLHNPATGERLLTASELAQQATAERQRAEIADQRAEAARQRAEMADQQAAAERQRADRLVAFLRSQGLDPDQV
jgi:Uma2 family endonuclease